MKHIITKILSVVAILTAMSMGATVHAETVNTRIGKLDFELGVPTKETVAKLYDEMDFQRACQLYLWALPAVNVAQATLYTDFVTGSHDGDAVILEGYRSVSGFLTPNVTTPYITGSMDLAATGPVVVEIPAGLIAGSAMDFWQRLLTDFGVTGPDQGKGGKYLFVGPGQEVPRMEGAIVLRSRTFRFMFYYRALDPDPVKAEALKKGVRMYPVEPARESAGDAISHAATRPRSLRCLQYHAAWSIGSGSRRSSSTSRWKIATAFLWRC